MRNVWTLAGREFRSYFNGVVAYIILAIVLLALGLLFWDNFFLQRAATARMMFERLSMLLVFATPAMTMGLLAEEKRTGTFELLITMPVRESEVILGKFFGVVGLLVALLALTITYPLTIASLGNLDWGPVWSGYLGLFLEGATMLGIGLMASSFTDNQIVAFFVALFINGVLWLLGFFLPVLPLAAASYLEWFSFGYHFDSLARGVIDPRDLIFFVSVTALCLAVAFRSVERRRWS